MNYVEAVLFLDKITHFGSNLGLDNINRLLLYLGNPQYKMDNVIHVAGTNGKGSVCEMLNSILIESGYSAGVFSSPHIENYYECIKINNQYISNEDFAKYVEVIHNACMRIINSDFPHPTLFEVLTAIAILFFYDSNLDFVIIETGLGGISDATNVFSSPLITIITSIDFDHMDYLGNSIKEIAMAKAGIIKDNIPIILAPNDDEVINIIKKVALSKNAPFIKVDSKKTNEKLPQIEYRNKIIVNENSVNYFNVLVHSSSKDGMCFSLSSPYYSFVKLRTKLLGLHQIENIATALTAISILQKLDYIITSEHIYTAINNLYLISRCEYINNPRHIIFDGSHNDSGMNALGDILDEYYKEHKITLVFGVLKDKEVEEMLKEILPIVDKLIITLPQNKRALDTSSVYNIASIYHDNITVIEDYRAAFDYALKTTDCNDLICCAGSLYLSVPLRNYFYSI